MDITLLICCSLTLLLAVAALVREVRLRRALQALLARILALEGLCLTENLPP